MLETVLLTLVSISPFPSGESFSFNLIHFTSNQDKLDSNTSKLWVIFQSPSRCNPLLKTSEESQYRIFGTCFFAFFLYHQLRATNIRRYASSVECNVVAVQRS